MDKESVVNALQQRARRRLIQGNDESALEDIREIVMEYRRMGMHELADTLQLVVNQFVVDSVDNLKMEIMDWENRHKRSDGVYPPQLYEGKEERDELIGKLQRIRKMLQNPSK